MTTNKDFYKAIQERRSIYAINKETTVSDEKLQEVLKDALKHTPSSFNSQSARIVLLLGNNHDQLWDSTKETLRKIVPAESFQGTEDKINSFKNGYGTVLFFEDMSVVEGLQQQFALYKDNFPIWSLESSGMLQFVVWTSLSLEGLGASLQHYNPLIDDKVKESWQVPNSWKLLGQMPFGKPVAPAGEKAYQSLDDRFKLFK